jgi:hypothetical protein
MTVFLKYLRDLREGWKLLMLNNGGMEMKKRIVSLFLVVAMMFVQVLSTVSVKAEEQFSVEVVVVGTQGVLAQGTSTNKNAKQALVDVLGGANVTMEQYTEGTSKGMIKKIGSLANSEDWSKYWYTAINRSNKYVPVYLGIEQLELNNKDRFLVYFNDFSTVTANKIIYSTNLPNEKLVINLNNVDYNGVVRPITGITLKVDGNLVKLTEKGEIIFENGLTEGKHTLSVSDYKTNDNEVPGILADKFEFTLSASGNTAGGTAAELYERDNRAVVKNIDNEITKASSFVGSTSEAWIALSLNKLGIKPNEDFIKRSAADIHKAGIKEFTTTELEKLIIGLTASGYNPYRFEKQDLASELYSRNIEEFIVNDTIFALIAYNYANISGNYEITKDILVKDLLSKKLSYTVEFVDKTGWALSGKAVDPDITAMAISALAPYYNTNKDVKAAVDKAVLTLSAMQNESGYILNNNGTAIEVTSETISSLILALTSIGVNPEGPQFSNEKGDLVSALLSFKAADGKFKHTLDGEADIIATEQALRALIALKEFKKNGTYNYYSSGIDSSKLPEFVLTEKELLDLGVLPQTGTALDFSMLVAAGIVFMITGTFMLKCKSLKSK